MSKKINFKPFVLVFILIISLILIIQIFTTSNFETILAAQGEIKDGFWTNALIIRDEKVVESPIKGNLNILISEGDRYSIGNKIAVLSSSNEKINFYNRNAGIISFSFDGLEKKVNLNNIDQINLNNFNKFDSNYNQHFNGDQIHKNKPLYRVINNFKLNIMVEVPKNYQDRFRVDELIFLQEKNTDQLIRAKISEIKYSLDSTYFNIELERFVSEWLSRRWIDLNIIKNIYRGIKIPKKAVFTQPSGQGVLTVNGFNKFKFKEVMVLDGNEDDVIVNGLEIGEEVIVNPEDFDYGREV